MQNLILGIDRVGHNGGSRLGIAAIENIIHRNGLAYRIIFKVEQDFLFGTDGGMSQQRKRD